MAAHNSRRVCILRAVQEGGLSVQEAMQHPMVPPAPGDSSMPGLLTKSGVDDFGHRHTVLTRLQAALCASTMQKLQNGGCLAPSVTLGHKLPGLMVQRLAKPA